MVLYLGLIDEKIKYTDNEQPVWTCLQASQVRTVEFGL